MANIKINRWDLIWSYIGSFLKLSINIILLPIILHYLSEEDLGMWYVFASIGQLAILLDFGFASSLSRNIAYVWSGADKLMTENISLVVCDRVNVPFFKQVLTTCRCVYLLIALIALFLMLSCGLPYIVSLTNADNVYLAWIIYSFGIFLNILYSYYTSFLRGVGAIAENNKAATISKVLQLVFTIVLLACGLGLVGITIAYFFSGIVTRLASRYYFYKYNNIKEMLAEVNVKVRLRDCIELFKAIWHNASKEGLVTVSNYLSTQANILICSSVLGLASSGFYGLSIQIATLVSNMSSILFSSYQAVLQEDAVTNNIEHSKKIFSTAYVTYVIVFIVLALCVCISMPVIQYLKPLMEINMLIFMCIMLNFFIHQSYHLFASFISTRNTLPYTKAFLISSIISVVMSYIIAANTTLGIWSLIVSPIIVSLSYNAWKWPCYSMCLLDLDFSKFINIGINEIKTIYRSKITTK